MIAQNSAPNCTKFPAKLKKFVWIDIFHPSFEPRDVKKILLTSLVCIWNLVVPHGLMAQARSKDEKTFIITQVQTEGEEFMVLYNWSFAHAIINSFKNFMNCDL